jgi:hypothetical protein
MKFTPTSVVFALAVATGAVLPIDDIRRTLSDKTTAPRLQHGHGDYPGPASAERFALLAQGSDVTRIAPDTLPPHEATV